MKQEEIDALLKKVGLGPAKGKGFDAKKYSGTVKFKGNPVKIQRKLRDEWK